MLNLTLQPLIQDELTPNEQLAWAGTPQQGLLFRPSDLFLIPFSLLWAGFALFWESGVISSGAPFFFMVWGIPFVLVGIYITIGRFFVDAYARSNTVYAVTNERIVIVTKLRSRQVKSLPLRTQTEITLDQHPNGLGTITFGQSMPFAAWYRGFQWPGMDARLAPAFERIADAKAVYDLIRSAQQVNT